MRYDSYRDKEPQSTSRASSLSLKISTMSRDLRSSSRMEHLNSKVSYKLLKLNYLDEMRNIT
jgi:hypothetical protein